MFSGNKHVAVTRGRGFYRTVEIFVYMHAHICLKERNKEKNVYIFNTIVNTYLCLTGLWVMFVLFMVFSGYIYKKYVFVSVV